MKGHKIFSLTNLLILFLAGGMVFAGGGDESASSEGPMDITFQTFYGSGQTEVNEGFVAKAVREQFPNWNFNIQWFTYSAYAEKLNLQIASGDLPPMTIVDTNIQLPRMVDEDQVLPLDDLIAEHGANLTKITPPWHWIPGTYDGEVMAIMNGWTTKVWGPMIRKDWLDNLGMAVPKTLDEYDTVLRAFTFKDPDGNGKDDTFGAGFREGVNWFDWVFHAFGVAPGHHHTGIWRQRGSQVEIDWVQPEMLDALKYIRTLYQDGVIIPESLTFSGADWTAAFNSGRMGTFYHSAGTLNTTAATIKEAYPDSEVISIAPPVGPGGQGSSDEPMHWGFVISKDAENPAEYVKLMDWSAGPGWDIIYGFFNNGTFPGAGFKELNASGQAVAWSSAEMSSASVQDALNKATNERFYSYLRPIDKWYATVSAADRAFYEKQDLTRFSEQYYAHLDNAAMYDVTSLKVKPVASEAEYWGSLRTKYREIMSKIVGTSNVDVDEVWNEWLAFWKANGGDEITKEVNASL